MHDVAGERYPDLVAAVLARALPGALLPARAAEALTHAAVRQLVGDDQTDGGTAVRHAVTTAVRHLLAA